MDADVLVGVRGLVTVPALNHGVHNLLEHSVGSGFSSNDAYAQVRGVESGLDGLVEGESHGRLLIAEVRVDLGLCLQGLASQRAMFVSDEGKVSNWIDGIHI